MKKLFVTMLAMFSFAALGNIKTIELSEKNTINFNNSFNSTFIAKKQIEAVAKCMANVGSEITIVAYSPGGSISAGQLFFDTLKGLPCKFNTLTIFGASMSYQMTQQLGKRYILPSGKLMSHRASVRGLGGEIGGELNSIINLLEKNVTELERIASSRVGLSLEEYRSQIRDELWLTGAEAVKRNHADEVVYARCDRTLTGTSTQVFRTMFGDVAVEFSNCPIITGILSIQLVGTSKYTVQQVEDYFTAKHKYITLEP